MKRMIDAEKFLDKLLYMGYMDEQKSEVEEVANNMIEEAIPKADYEARLRADMATMLEELRGEIIDFDSIIPSNPDDEYYLGKDNGYNEAIFDVADYIQQKIQSLKEQEDGNK